MKLLIDTFYSLQQILFIAFVAKTAVFYRACHLIIYHILLLTFVKISALAMCAVKLAAFYTADY